MPDSTTRRLMEGRTSQMLQIFVYESVTQIGDSLQVHWSQLDLLDSMFMGGQLFHILVELMKQVQVDLLLLMLC